MKRKNCGIEENTVENPVESGEIKIYRCEIKVIFKNLKNGKAAGVGGIAAEMLKSGDEYLSERLSGLMNICSMNGEVPNGWRKAIIVPLYKGKGDKGNCPNYRAISFPSTVGKTEYRKTFESRQKSFLCIC